jgi:hypothetical protein
VGNMEEVASSVYGNAEGSGVLPISLLKTTAVQESVARVAADKRADVARARAEAVGLVGVACGFDELDEEEECEGWCEGDIPEGPPASAAPASATPASATPPPTAALV